MRGPGLPSTVLSFASPSQSYGSHIPPEKFTSSWARIWPLSTSTQPGMSSYTKEQEKAVLRVLSCKPDQYYEILEVETTASEHEIKRSYRKLAVKLHPDKNSHPRASEAFKYLNKAWGVLSDPGKKRLFDQTGSDKEPIFGGGSGAPASGSNVFEDDIFNLFFGGGGGGGFPRGGTTFTFGGNNGFAFQSFGNGGFDPFTASFQQQQRQRQRQRQRQAQNGGRSSGSSWETLWQLAPVFFILLATLLSSLFSGDSTPDYSFTKTNQYALQRQTPTFKIPFYVKEEFVKDKSLQKLKNFDSKVENIYIQDRRTKCSREQVRKNELMQDAQGWFFTDQRKLERAQGMPMPNCQELRNLNLL